MDTIAACRAILASHGKDALIAWLEQENAELEAWQSWVDEVEDGPFMDALVAAGPEFGKHLFSLPCVHLGSPE